MKWRDLSKEKKLYTGERELVNLVRGSEFKRIITSLTQSPPSSIPPRAPCEPLFYFVNLNDDPGQQRVEKKPPV